MCLIIVDNPPPTERIPVFKKLMFHKDSSILLSPFRYFEYKVGINQAKGNLEIQEVRDYDWEKKQFFPQIKYRKIDSGIFHCFTNEIQAGKYQFGSVVIKGYAEPEDFVAWGTNEEVGVKKFSILKEDFDSALEKYINDNIKYIIPSVNACEI